MASEIFLIDSDALIAPYHLYYAFDLLHYFWSFVSENITLKKIKIMDKVYDEITANDDDLSNWLSAVDDLDLVEYKDSEIIGCYGNILNYIQGSPLYQDTALKSWSASNVADPWLIAAAKKYSYTVITFETPNASLNTSQPTKKVKIPDICRQFDVKYENLFYMMRKLGWKQP
jgi:hypothetical protein